MCAAAGRRERLKYFRFTSAAALKAPGWSLTFCIGKGLTCGATTSWPATFGAIALSDTGALNANAGTRRAAPAPTDAAAATNLRRLILFMTNSFIMASRQTLLLHPKCRDFGGGQVIASEIYIAVDSLMR